MKKEQALVEMMESIHRVQTLDQEFIENTIARLNLLEDKMEEILQFLRLRVH